MLQFILLFPFLNIMPALAAVFYVTRNSRDINLIDRLILSAIFSPFLLVFVSFLEEIARVPQNAIVLAVNVALLSAINIFLVARFFRSKEYFSLKITPYNAVAYLLFVGLILFRTLPALELLTPLLHDPIAHSEWLKHLNVTHFTTMEQWYPQGLEYYLNYLVTFGDFSYAEIVLLSNNFLLAVFPISLYYLAVLFIKGEKKAVFFPFLMLFVAAFLPYPKNLIYTAGKNSMVFAFSVTPLIFYLLIRGRSRLELIFASVAVFSVFVVHYPTGFFLLFSGVVIGFSQFIKRDDTGSLVDKKLLFHYLIAALMLAVFLLIAIVFKIAPAYLSAPPASADGSIVYFTQLINEKGRRYFLLKDFFDQEVNTFGLNAVLLGIAAVAAYPFAAKERFSKFIGLMLLSLAALFAAEILLLLPSDRTYAIFYRFELLSFTLFALVAAIAWLFQAILSDKLQLARWRASRLSIVLLLAVAFLYCGYKDYQEYLFWQNGLKTTSELDLAAFRFIDAEIADDHKFLIQLSGGEVIMGSDSGVWIPSFTTKQVEVDFREFILPKSQTIFRLYIDVAQNSENLAAIEQLYCSHDIGYIFFGSRKVFSANMQEGKLDTSKYFEKIFSNGASIYRIKPLNCPA